VSVAIEFAILAGTWSFFRRAVHDITLQYGDLKRLVATRILGRYQYHRGHFFVVLLEIGEEVGRRLQAIAKHGHDAVLVRCGGQNTVRNDST
jgi:hypothetical protein